MKIGRNDPCSCGSGIKYKKCCGGNMEKENNGGDQKGTEIEFVIKFNTLNGSISVSHPTDKLLAYGMLEFARKMIDDYRPQQQSLIQPASGLSIVPTRKLS